MAAMSSEARVEAEVVRRLTEAGLRLSTAESTVGGMIGHLLTNVPGSSKVFIGGITAYHGAPKMDLLGVPRDLLREHGSVAEETVLAMARGARDAMQTELAIAESGIAGPSTNPERPGGLYWIALVAPGGFEVAQRHVFPGDREETKRAASEATLQLVLDWLDERDA